MNYLGIDVAKVKLDCCLLLNDNRQKSKVVPNSEEGFEQLVAWCGKQGFLPADLHVVMESTGCYHEPVAHALVRAGMQVSILNPARVREFAKSQGILSKNDRLDAFAIARFGASSKPELWQPPAPEVSHLQALLLRREAVEQDLQRETNRREKMAFTHAPVAVQASLREHIAYLEQERDKLSEEIDRHIDQHPDLKKDRALLQSIPGVGPKVSAVMLASIRQGRFACAEQSAAYLGLVPVERQSGSSVKGRARLSKNGSARVRATLYMAAVCAKTYNPHIRQMAMRMAQRGKCNMSILGAAMRKLVHLCFGVIKNQTPYQPTYLPKQLTG
jgi:transposase